MKTYTITCISDSHNKHNQLNLNGGGDFLIHAGDISSMGYHHEVKSFLDWFSKQDYKYKIFIAGNHDFLFERSKPIAQELLAQYPNVIYLENSEVVIEGIKFYGSPYSPIFYDWAFMYDEAKRNLICDMIPSDTDVLITHTPPKHILDMNLNFENCGCNVLYERFLVGEQLKNVKIHCFGHLHPNYGVKQQFNTTFYNAAVLNDNYTLANEPHIIEYIKD
jgi:Icc-related predicted phosphoesterase